MGALLAFTGLVIDPVGYQGGVGRNDRAAFVQADIGRNGKSARSMAASGGKKHDHIAYHQLARPPIQ